MSRMLFASNEPLPSHALREIAPGVWIQVRRAPRMMSAPAVLHDVRDRIGGVLATITGQRQTINLQDYLERVERKAA